MKVKLTDYSLKLLVPIINGEEGISKKLTGPELVNLFNSFGARDIYDFDNGGLPKSAIKDRNLTRKEYTFDRIKKLNCKNVKDLIEKIANDNSSDVLQQRINEIISPENFRLEKGANSYFIVGQESMPEEIVKEVQFEDIQSRILNELSKAKFQILVAVAWFTDEVLFKKLIEKKKEGVNIQIIISNDEINKKYGVPISEHFESYKIEKTKFDNLMHNKFCIIDLSTVINGSYNWTKKAQYNKENITVDYSRQLAEIFAEKFNQIKLGKV